MYWLCRCFILSSKFPRSLFSEKRLMTLPNFLIIGATKSGTTALHTYLQQHPDIFMSKIKELRYFSYLSSPPFPDVPDKYIFKGVTTLEEYKNHFRDATNQKIIGESSPMYLYYPGTAEQIKIILPNVKMLVILRNPVDRAFSAYSHAVRDWLENSTSFREALAKESERIKAGWGILWHYTQAGYYFDQLRRYYAIFNPDQIKVVLYDDLVRDACGVCKEIFIFLKVDENFIPDTSKHLNISGIPKNKSIHSLMKSIFFENNLLKRISLFILPKSFCKKVMVNLRMFNLEKQTIPEKTRKDLLNLFKKDIMMLEKLINRDLSCWLKE